MFIRRDLKGQKRLVGFRVGLFFLAAGLWIAGVAVGNDLVTGAAIVIAAIGLVVALIVRKWGGAENQESSAEAHAASGEAQEY